MRSLLLLFILLLTPPARGAGAGAPAPLPTARTTRQIEGWTVQVDDRLLAPPHAELGARTLRFLEAKLADIILVMPPEQLARLRAVSIVVDLDHGALRSMQYHPSAAWLAGNGYSTGLVRCVHIPIAAQLATARNVREQPWVILHELAHAYHDQHLGFDDARIRDAYEQYRAGGRGEATLLHNGTRVHHYGLTDHKEFFAEMTEAYFGANDFFPFNRAELLTAEPAIHALIQSIWSPAPAR